MESNTVVMHTAAPINNTNKNVPLGSTFLRVQRGTSPSSVFHPNIGGTEDSIVTLMCNDGEERTSALNISNDTGNDIATICACIEVLEVTIQTCLQRFNDGCVVNAGSAGTRRKEMPWMMKCKIFYFFLHPWLGNKSKQLTCLLFDINQYTLEA